MEYLKFTPELANDWKNALSSSEPYVFKRVNGFYESISIRK